MADDRTTLAPEHEAPHKNGAPAQGTQPENNQPEERQEDKDTEKEKDDEQHKKPSPWKTPLIIAAVVVVAIVGLLWWLHSRHYEDTDDAQVDGHTSGIASRIAGTVTAVYVEENQFVKSGEVVVDLDPRDYQVALDQARGQLAEAQAQTQAEQPNVPVTQVTNQTTIATANSDIVSAEAAVAAAQRDYDAALAKVQEAEANNVKAQTDVERYRPLAEKDEVPREQFDQVVATAKAQAATVASNQASAASALKEIDQRKAELAATQKRAEQARENALPQIEIRRANVEARRSTAPSARAQLEQAMLNLSYCKITTPVNGIVAKRMAEVGDRSLPASRFSWWLKLTICG